MLHTDLRKLEDAVHEYQQQIEAARIESDDGKRKSVHDAKGKKKKRKDAA